MTLTPLTAVSPLDGRYAGKLAALRPIMSELGYMHRRVQVELAWFIALSDAGFDEFKPLSGEARAYLASLVRDFSEDDGAAIKVNGKPLRYFDTANTSQKPAAVIEATDDF